MCFKDEHHSESVRRVCHALQLREEMRGSSLRNECNDAAKGQVLAGSFLLTIHLAELAALALVPVLAWAGGTKLCPHP